MYTDDGFGFWWANVAVAGEVSVFKSPRRLNPRVVCTSKTPASDTWISGCLCLSSFTTSRAFTRRNMKTNLQVWIISSLHSSTMIASVKSKLLALLQILRVREQCRAFCGADTSPSRGWGSVRYSRFVLGRIHTTSTIT